MMETLKFAVEIAAEGIEILAVAIILAGLGLGTIRFLLHATAPATSYSQYKEILDKALLLGLNVLVAADIVRTVALEPDHHKHHRLGPAGFGPHLPELVLVRRTGRALAMATRTTSNRRARQLTLPLARDAIERVHHQPPEGIDSRTTISSQGCRSFLDRFEGLSIPSCSMYRFIRNVRTFHSPIPGN